MQTHAILVGLLAGAVFGAMPADGWSATDENAMRISAAFQKLGMASARSRCYGEVISRVMGKDAVGAAEVLEKAKDKHDVREGVVNGGVGTMDAFREAWTTCDI